MHCESVCALHHRGVESISAFRNNEYGELIYYEEGWRVTSRDGRRHIQRLALLYPPFFRSPIQAIEVGTFHTSKCGPLKMATDSQARVDALFASLLEAYDHHYGFGAMTCCVYDTAWVANVTKTVAGVPQYLFPSAFQYVLDAQLLPGDGSWNAHYHPGGATESFVCKSSTTPSDLSDSILSTMAALYTLIIHAISPQQIRPARIPAPSLPLRIARAVGSLQRMLHLWRVNTCNAVGFEILIPALLDLLTKQGYDFDFPDRAALLEIRAAKLDRVRPAMLYQMAPVALLHSLEAFHGWTPEELDVSKLEHHLVRGSMMASPAATASYLMKSQTWNDEAEAYLRLAIERGDGKGSGGVPSAWPSTYFEILWVR